VTKEPQHNPHAEALGFVSHPNLTTRYERYAIAPVESGSRINKPPRKLRTKL
jgi:hypothetical protein